jgi:hypothetical protein
MMGKINGSRWILGGVVSGVFIWLVEGAASMLYMADMEAAMKAHQLSMEMSAGMMFQSLLVSLIMGLVAVFLYAAARPRFGPGPKTAVVVGCAVFLSGYLIPLIGYNMMDLFPVSLLVVWGVVGFVEIVLATLIGAWLYREN